MGNIEQARNYVGEANNCTMSKFIDRVECLKRREKLLRQAIEFYEEEIKELTKNNVDNNDKFCIYCKESMVTSRDQLYCTVKKKCVKDDYTCEYFSE